jgi:hypothetical protein
MTPPAAPPAAHSAAPPAALPDVPGPRSTPETQAQVPDEPRLLAAQGRASRRWRRATAGLLGLALGVVATEAAFRVRDGGAFPLVNIYETDAARGVRLRPGAATRVGRPGAAVTTVRVNDAGYRGAAWPAPSGRDVLVVGDSQPFGLGVAEEDTLARRLGPLLPGAPAVLDASVPTYGPPEYLGTISGLLPTTRPATLVVVINPMNDLFEVERSGPERHAVVDGWAVRRESLPPGYAPSALRTALIARSHAAFAIWRWHRTRQAAALPAPPDPSWPSLVSLSARLSSQDRPAAPAHDPVADALHAAEAEATGARLGLAGVVQRRHGLVAWSGQTEREWSAYARSGGEPADQVFELSYGGCAPAPWGRSLFKARFSGEQIRHDVEEKLRALTATPYLDQAVAAEIRAALARKDAADAALAALRATARDRPPPLPTPAVRAPSPLAHFLEEASRLSRSHGARLAVVVLPLPLQTSPAAMAREGAGDEAAAAITSLLARVSAEARDAGAVVIEPAEALHREGDAAYQPDGHLTAAGHRALASAVAAALTPG